MPSSGLLRHASANNAEIEALKRSLAEKQEEFAGEKDALTAKINELQDALESAKGEKESALGALKKELEEKERAFEKEKAELTTKSGELETEVEVRI